VFEEYYINFLDYGFEIIDFNNQKVIPLMKDDIAWTDDLDQFEMIYGQDDQGHDLYVYPYSEILRLMKTYRGDRNN
jgi:hypothetical protein